MHPTPDQRLAIEAMLSGLLGPTEFERLCLGMTVGLLDENILYVFVADKNCAAEIEANYSDDFAVAAEQVFSVPIRTVNVLPKDLSDHN